MESGDEGPSEREVRIIRIIVANEKPVMGTNEIAEHFDISQQAMTRHLNRMHEKDALNTEKIGRVRVWWPTEKGLSYLQPV